MRYHATDASRYGEHGALVQGQRRNTAVQASLKKYINYFLRSAGVARRWTVSQYSLFHLPQYILNITREKLLNTLS